MILLSYPFFPGSDRELKHTYFQKKPHSKRKKGGHGLEVIENAAWSQENLLGEIEDKKSE